MFLPFCSRVVKLLRDQLPSSLLPKVLVSLHSFGAREHLTRLVDERWERQEQATAGWGWSNHKAQRNYGQYVQSAGQYGANGGGAMNSAARIEEVVEIVAAGSSSVSASVSGGANSRVSGGFRLQSTAALRVGFASGVMAPPPPPPLPPPPSLPPKKYSEVVRATASSNTANHISNSSSSNYQQQSVISIGSSGSGDDSESGVEVIGEVLGDVEVEVEKAGEMSDREAGSNYRYSSSSGGNNRGKQHSSYGGGSSSRKNNVGNKGGRGKSANWHKKSLSKPYRKPGQVYSNS